MSAGECAVRELNKQPNSSLLSSWRIPSQPTVRRTLDTWRKLLVRRCVSDTHSDELRVKGLFTVEGVAPGRRVGPRVGVEVSR